MADGGSSKYNDLRYIFMRGLIRHERSQRSRHYLKQAAECTSKAIVSLELSEQAVKTVKQARKLEAIGGETCIRLTKLESERNFSCVRPLGGRFVSSAGGILVALTDLTQETYNGGHSEDKPVLLPESRVKERASQLTEESFQDNNLEVFCPAWWRLEVLIKRGFIKRRSQKKAPVLQLLPRGKQTAQLLRDRNGLPTPTAILKLPELPCSPDGKGDHDVRLCLQSEAGEDPVGADREVTLARQAIQERSLYTNDDGTDGLLLMVDTQEMGGQRVGLGEVCQLLGYRGVRYRTQKLKVADYSWVWRCQDREIELPWLVERKRADDLAGTLKEGRFWSQVSRMVTWKDEFTERGASCKLYYLLERRPEEYVVKCTDGCQGIGQCGNPTLRQIKLVIEDLHHHPQLLVRESDSLETSILFLASLTSELKEGIAAGKFDALLTQELGTQSSHKFAHKRHGNHGNITSDQTLIRTKADCDNKSTAKSEHKLINNKEKYLSSPVFIDKQELADFESDSNKISNLSYEEQIELAIQISLKTDNKKDSMLDTVNDESCYMDGLNVELRGGDTSKYGVSGYCRAVSTDSDLDYEREDRDLEVVTTKPHMNLDHQEQDPSEDKDLELAIQRSKLDLHSHSCESNKVQLAHNIGSMLAQSQNDIKNVVLTSGQRRADALCYQKGEAAGLVQDKEEVLCHPLMQYHCSEGGSVIYPHKTGRREAPTDQHVYRPKMNRKRTLHTKPSSPAAATLTTEQRTQITGCPDNAEHYSIKFKTKISNSVPTLNTLNTSTCRSNGEIGTDNVFKTMPGTSSGTRSDTSDTSMSSVEYKKVLSANENHRHLKPSCTQSSMSNTSDNSRNMDLQSPWQSINSDCADFTERQKYVGSGIEETVDGVRSGLPRKSMKKNKHDISIKQYNILVRSSGKKVQQLDSAEVYCYSSKNSRADISTESSVIQTQTTCGADVKLNTNTDTVSIPTKPKRIKLNFSPSPAYTETNIINFKYGNKRRATTNKKTDTKSVIKVEAESDNMRGECKKDISAYEFHRHLDPSCIHPTNSYGERSISDRFDSVISSLNSEGSYPCTNKIRIETEDSSSLDNTRDECKKVLSANEFYRDLEPSCIHPSSYSQTTDSTCGYNSDEDLFPELDDNDVKGHSENQSNTSKSVIDEAGKYSSESDGCSKAVWDSSSEDSNISLPDLEQQITNNSTHLQPSSIFKNQSTASTEHSIHSKTSKTETDAGRVYVDESPDPTGTKNSDKDLDPTGFGDSDTDLICDTTNIVPVAAEATVEKRISSTDGTTDTGPAHCRVEDSVRTVLAILPQVSASVVRSTLTTCNGNVEMCVAILLETQPDT